MITAGDLKAALDVVKQLTNEIDDLDAEQAIGFRSDVEALQKEAKFCHELLTTRAVNALDGQPAVIDGKVYAAKTTGKWRPDHRAIIHLISLASLEAAIDLKTGEVVPADGVATAITMMYDAFVSPATMPKQGFLEKQGISNKTIATWERGKKELKVMELEKEVDDE